MIKLDQDDVLDLQVEGANLFERSDVEIRNVSLAMVFFAAVIIIVVLSLAYTSESGTNSSAGYTAVIGASFIFGATGIQ